jgi:hypothetical protein
VLRTPECGAELSLPTADLFGCALTRTPEQNQLERKSSQTSILQLEPAPPSLSSALGGVRE